MFELEYSNEPFQAKLDRQQQQMLLLRDVVRTCHGDAKPRQVFQVMYRGKACRRRC